MLLVPMNFFSLTGTLCSEGKRFGRANVIFAVHFILKGHDTHTNFLWLLFIFGMNCPLVQGHFI